MSEKVPTSAPSPTLPTDHTKGKEATSLDGLDLRKYMSLSPLQQLERLEADCAALKKRERFMREVESGLKSAHIEEVK